MTSWTIRCGRALALAGISLAAHATGLVDVWHLALRNAPEIQAATADQRAGAARREQGDALWRPQVSLGASAGLGGASSDSSGASFSAPGFGAFNGADFGTSVRDGTATTWALQARKPLLNPALDAQSRQLGLSAEAADAGWSQAQQDLILRAAQSYFDLALAQNRLALLQQQQAASQRTLQEARDRFALGDLPVTDLREAQAQSQALEVQVLQARDALEIARAALQDLAGSATVDWQAKLPAQGLPETTPGLDAPLAQWLERSDAASTEIAVRRIQWQVAQQESARQSAQNAPTLDLIVQANGQSLRGDADLGSATNSARQTMLGIALTVPLYTGGYRDARLHEALAMEERSRAEYERTRQRVHAQLRADWLLVHTGAQREQALADALLASQARRDATVLGKSVGDRSTLDVLHAESDLGSAQLLALESRVRLAMAWLRMQANAGQLAEPALQQLDALMPP